MYGDKSLIIMDVARNRIWKTARFICFCGASNQAHMSEEVYDGVYDEVWQLFRYLDFNDIIVYDRKNTKDRKVVKARLAVTIKLINEIL